SRRSNGSGLRNHPRSPSPCLGWRVVSPCCVRCDFWISHYITLSSPSGGSGGRISDNFSAFTTRRASGEPPLIKVVRDLHLRFRLNRIVFVGDRGMVTEARCFPRTRAASPRIVTFSVGTPLRSPTDC